MRPHRVLSAWLVVTDLVEVGVVMSALLGWLTWTWMRPHRVTTACLASFPVAATSAAQLVLLGGLTRTLIRRHPAHCVDPEHSQREA
eukprot:COSAG02_NODE_49138_length_328_cov_8.637555_1_plen_86_part_10